MNITACSSGESGLDTALTVRLILFQFGRITGYTEMGCGRVNRNTFVRVADNPDRTAKNFER